MIDGVYLVAEAIRAEQKAAEEAAGKVDKTSNLDKSPEDPVTAITGGKKKAKKKTEPEPQTEPEPGKTDGDDEPADGDGSDNSKEE